MFGAISLMVVTASRSPTGMSNFCSGMRLMPGVCASGRLLRSERRHCRDQRKGGNSNNEFVQHGASPGATTMHARSLVGGYMNEDRRAFRGEMFPDLVPAWAAPNEQHNVGILARPGAFSAGSKWAPQCGLHRPLIGLRAAAGADGVIIRQGKQLRTHQAGSCQGQCVRYATVDGRRSADRR